MVSLVFPLYFQHERTITIFGISKIHSELKTNWIFPETDEAVIPSTPLSKICQPQFVFLSVLIQLPVCILSLIDLAKAVETTSPYQPSNHATRICINILIYSTIQPTNNTTYGTQRVNILDHEIIALL